MVAAACLVLTLEPITAPAKKPWLAWFSLAILVVCFGITAGRLGTHATAFSDLIVIDPYGSFWKLLLYTITGLIILLSLAYLKAERIHLVEYYAFILLSLAGVRRVPASLSSVGKHRESSRGTRHQCYWF